MLPLLRAKTCPPLWVPMNVLANVGRWLAGELDAAENKERFGVVTTAADTSSSGKQRVSALLLLYIQQSKEDIPVFSGVRQRE